MPSADSRVFVEQIVKRWMYKDVGEAISRMCNYLVALALTEYTEILGAHLRDKVGVPEEGGRNFDAFFRLMKQVNPEYGQFETELASKATDPKKKTVYAVVRCGLAHEYFLKVKSNVENDPNDPKGECLSGPVCGLYYDPNDPDRLTLNVNRYLHDFKLAVDQFELMLPP